MNDAPVVARGAQEPRPLRLVASCYDAGMTTPPANARFATWLDHHEARVFHVAAAGFEESTIHAPLKHIRHPKHAQGLKAHENDNHDFFRELARALDGAGEVLVLGPSTAKLQFIRFLHAHEPALESKVVGVETVDHPTDPQIAAYAKQYFKAADRLL
jgi:stalled ribosome rescue protein Dom34